MDMKPKIVVIGSSNTDMICRVPHIPKPGETVLGSDFLTVQGGKGANQAVAAARAGGNVTFVACVGNDLFGKQAIESYKADGIDTSCISLVDDAPTGVALINVAGSGENSIAVASGANAKLTPAVIDKYRDVILSAQMILMQLEIPIETVYHVAQLAFAAQIPLVLNPAPAQEIDPAILPMISCITPNEHEAVEVSGIFPPGPELVSEMADKILLNGTQSVIITLGNKGAYYREGNQEEIVPGIAVQAVDTTAAGDTFNGYLVVELAKGKTLREAISLANKAAAISVTRMGAQPSIPYFSEIP